MPIVSSCQLLPMLFISVPCAVRGHFLRSQSPVPLQVLRVDEILIFGVHACAVLRGALVPPQCGHHSRCVRHCFLRVSKEFQADVSHVVVAVVQRGLALPSGSLADQAIFLQAITYRTFATLMTPAAVAAFHLPWCLLIRGHSSTSSALH